MSTQRLASNVGQICRIALPSYPGSGATWYVDGANGAVRVCLEESQATVAQQRDGSQVFSVIGEVAGDYELRFVLKRAWEREVRNSRRVVLQVRSLGGKSRAN
ncbi:MAG: protease inhibitor I42 family protein [Proteobacteria bacterium]|nr:protease inhibitor I42 family protein [Pseudomonadota bacterium]